MKFSSRPAMVFLFILFSSPIILLAEDPVPDWWESVSLDMPRMETAERQYFHIRTTYLRPAYRADGRSQRELLQQSIKAHTQLIEWFPQRKHRPTACMAQFLIAEAYRKLQDNTLARRAYEKVLAYRQYIPPDPQKKGQLAIRAIVTNAETKLERLR